jgi:hypothetical protein
MLDSAPVEIILIMIILGKLILKELKGLEKKKMPNIIKRKVNAIKLNKQVNKQANKESNKLSNKE